MRIIKQTEDDDSSDDDVDHDANDDVVITREAIAVVDKALNNDYRDELSRQDVAGVADWASAVIGRGDFSHNIVRVKEQLGRGGQGGVFRVVASDDDTQQRVLELTEGRGVAVKVSAKVNLCYAGFRREFWKLLPCEFAAVELCTC